MSTWSFWSDEELGRGCVMTLKVSSGTMRSLGLDARTTCLYVDMADGVAAEDMEDGFSNLDEPFLTARSRYSQLFLNALKLLRRFEMLWWTVTTEVEA